MDRAQEGDMGVRYRLIDAEARPWRHGFQSLLRYIAAQHRHTTPQVGRALHPREEPFRLGQQPTLAFAPRELAAIEIKEHRPRIRLFGLGMLGPNGPLPIHFTEMAKDRLDNRQDATLVNFLDIFHHRSMTHLYRAWEQSQAAAGLDRPEDERFSRYISHLAGNDPADIRLSPLPSHARMAASAHLISESRTPDGLSATLARYFSVPVEIRENIPHWISVPADECTRLGEPCVAGILGEGALAGEWVPDRQHKFRIVVGPLTLSQYLRFTPNGQDIPILVEWVRAFVGFEYVWDVELLILANEVPQPRIGSDERLGWSTWLGGADRLSAVTGMIFEPEVQM